MTSKKVKAIEDIKEIRRTVKELNEAHQPAINQTLDGVNLQLKQYLVKKQAKLENYVSKLQKMTKDEVASGLLDTILGQLRDVSSGHENVLKLESQANSPSELKNMEFHLMIISQLFYLIQKLQIIEEILNTHIGDPQLDED